jgi:hypothetical protein
MINASQQRTVATMGDPRFKEEFFAVQGPPGCGKKAKQQRWWRSWSLVV